MQRSYVAIAAVALLAPLAACSSDPPPAPVVVTTPPPVIATPAPTVVVPVAPAVDAASLIEKCKSVLHQAYPNQVVTIGAPRADPVGDITTVSMPYVVGYQGSASAASSRMYNCRFQGMALLSSGMM